MKIKKFFIHNSLFIILLLAAFLRLWKLNTIPPGLTPDEASLGYNAYSILETGRDEYGQVLPIIFKSFGDYKPGLYVYATVPFVALFGLSEWAVRLPSALAGVLIVWLLYKIVSFLFVQRSLITNHMSLISMAVAFSAAINPWLITFSRGAWEANLSLMLTLAGIYHFLKGVCHPEFISGSKNNKMLNQVRHDKFSLPLSVVVFSLTFITYQGAKLSTSIVVFLLIVTYWKRFWSSVSKNISVVTASILIASVICIPVVSSLFSGQTGRLKVYSVFSYPRPLEYTKQFLDQGGEKIGDMDYFLFHSETLNLARGVMGRWYNHFSGKFLFFDGDYANPRHTSPYSGMMQLIDILFLPLGFIFLVRTKKINTKSKTLIFLWLLLAPLSAALSKDQVQAVRSLNMAVPLVVLSGFGLYYPLFITHYSKWKLPLYLFLATGLFASSVYFLDSYFVHVPTHNAKHWQYGFKEVIKEIAPIQDKYERIIFQQSYSQPYIYFLFYQKYDPNKYQNQANLNDGGLDVGLVEKIDNIDFVSYSWPPAISASDKTLVVGDSVVIPHNFPGENFNVVKEIKYPDGVSTAFRIIETKNNY